MNERYVLQRRGGSSNWLDDRAGFCLTALVQLLCCLLSSYNLFSYISLLVFGASLVKTVFDNPKIIIKYLYFYFMVISNIVGVACCELGSFYLQEMYVYSHFAGSLPLIIFSRWLFLELIQYLDLRWGVKSGQAAIVENNFWGKARKPVLATLNFAILILASILFLHLAARPFFIMSMDRVQYTDAYLTGIYGTISSYLYILMIIPIIRLRDRVSPMPIATVLLYLLILFWSGVKFGSYFSLLCIVTTVFYDRLILLDVRIIRRVFVCIVSIVGCLIISASMIQSVYSTYDSSDYLPARIAQQGELWWRSYDMYGVEPHLDQLLNEIGNLTTDAEVSDSVGADYGIYGVMYRTVPQLYVDRYLSGGARYTEAGSASFLYSFGFLGPFIFALVMGCLAFAIQNGVVLMVSHGNIVGSILVYRLFVLLCTALSMATFGQFFSGVSIVSYAILVLVYLLSRDDRKRPSIQASKAICELR